MNEKNPTLKDSGDLQRKATDENSDQLPTNVERVPEGM